MRRSKPIAENRKTRTAPAGPRIVARGVAQRSPWFVRVWIIPPRRGGGTPVRMCAPPLRGGVYLGTSHPGVPLRFTPGPSLSLSVSNCTLILAMPGSPGSCTPSPSASIHTRSPMAPVGAGAPLGYYVSARSSIPITNTNWTLQERIPTVTAKPARRSSAYYPDR